jgi:SAM-dependent methyltransferase
MGVVANAHEPRISSFVCDSTAPAEAHRFDGLDADVVLIMFTLSAVTPDQQHQMLRNAFRALRPGGLLLLRDHGGCGDGAQLVVSLASCLALHNVWDSSFSCLQGCLTWYSCASLLTNGWHQTFVSGWGSVALIKGGLAHYWP